MTSMWSQRGGQEREGGEREREGEFARLLQHHSQQRVSAVRSPAATLSADEPEQSAGLNLKFLEEEPGALCLCDLLERKRETFTPFPFFSQPRRGMPSINMKLEMVTIIACEVDTEVFTSDKMQVRFPPKRTLQLIIMVVPLRCGCAAQDRLHAAL